MLMPSVAGGSGVPLIAAGGPVAAKILVVDDEPSVLAVVSRALRDEGHEVIAVSNGQTAYDVTLEETVDVVVTNNCMPGLNGAELVKALRKRLPTSPFCTSTITPRAPPPPFRCRPMCPRCSSRSTSSP